MVTKRNERRYYLNVGDESAPVWTPVGRGFLKFEEERHTISRTRRYYHESDEWVRNEGYATEIRYEAEVCIGETAAELIRRITDEEKYGEAAVVRVMTVDMTDCDSFGAYAASVREYTVIPDKTGGTDSLIYSGRLAAAGEIEKGVFVISTGKFVA